MIIGEGLQELEERYMTWKNIIEIKCLKVNIEKTNEEIMKSVTNEGLAFASGKYPCGVCKKGIGVNTVYHSFCRHWLIHQILCTTNTCSCLREMIHIRSN